jgi:hypothetical protein
LQVGVGNADFDAMDVLDADDEPLRCARTRRLMQRDIVQFVPYRDFRHAGTARLAEEVLAEIPEQVLGFMRAGRIVPGGGWSPSSLLLPAAAAAAGGEEEGQRLARTTSGRLIEMERTQRLGVGGEVYESMTEQSEADRELQRIRARIAAAGGNGAPRPCY